MSRSAQPTPLRRAQSTMDRSDIRTNNLSLVLDTLLVEGPVSRADLARSTGLTKATVSSLVDELVRRGLAADTPPAPTGAIGRPASVVSVDTVRTGTLAVVVDVDRVIAAVVDLTGTVRFERSRHGDHPTADPSVVLASAGRLARDVLADAAAAGMRCTEATLALPGLVDPLTGHLHVAPNLHWFSLDDAPATVLALPSEVRVTVDNEANLSAVAELHHGVGRRVRSFVAVSVGVGVGAGVVLDGRLVRGAHGFAGELGHVVVDPDGPVCGCGARGCLEAVVRARRTGPRPDDELVAPLTRALRSLVHLIDPDEIVLGGALADLGPGFAARVAAQLAADTLGARWHPCAVSTSELGARSVVLGAAAAAVERVVADPTSVAEHDGADPTTHHRSTTIRRSA